MKTFVVLAKNEIKDYFHDVFYVSEDFSFVIMFFGAFWALYHKMWQSALFIILINLSIIMIYAKGRMSFSMFEMIFLLFNCYVGYAAKDWLQESLLAKGYKFKDVIIAHNLEEAQLKFLERLKQSV